jgi:hypothetical protein
MRLPRDQVGGMERARPVSEQRLLSMFLSWEYHPSNRESHIMAASPAARRQRRSDAPTPIQTEGVKWLEFSRY